VRQDSREISPIFATRASSQNATNCLPRICKLLFEPAFEGEIKERPNRVFGSDLKQRINLRFDWAFS
jgi:hypothetical protein